MNQFITISAAHYTSRATIRSGNKPWAVLATCTNTSGPLHAAEAVARKAGFTGYRVELVPTGQWNEATNGYIAARRTHAIEHIYRLVR